MNGPQHRPPTKYEQALERSRDDLERTDLLNMIDDLPNVYEVLVDGDDEDWRPTTISIGFGDAREGTGEVEAIMRRQGWCFDGVTFSPYNRLHFKECGSDD